MAQPDTPRRATTLADVGREAGVSAMAASAVLNGAKTSSRISEPTRARIVAAAERLQYRRNGAARGLAARRLHTVGVASTVSGQGELNQYFLEVFNGVIEAAAAAGQNTTVFALPDWQAGVARIPALCDGRIDGLILLAPLFDAGEGGPRLPAHLPFVSVHANHALPGVVNVESDEEAGAYRMVRQLLAMGHWRILHLGGPTSSLGARRRAEAWRNAYADAGIAEPEDHVVHTAYSIDGGRRALQAWLARQRGRPLPSAVFAGNDAIALGCLDELAARGLRVPEDVSVVGFDDTLVARSAQLATVRQPLREMGHRAVELLVARIDARHAGQPDPATPTQVLPTELVPGRSLGAPRATPLAIA